MTLAVPHWVINEVELLALLNRAKAGEEPDDLFMEMRGSKRCRGARCSVPAQRREIVDGDG